jgi:hypothetical protein
MHEEPNESIGSERERVANVRKRSAYILSGIERK